MNTAEMILNFAGSQSSFTLNELAVYIHRHADISNSGILWHLKHLIMKKKLQRISRGVYGSNVMNEFIPSLPPDLRDLCLEIKKAFPLIETAAYSGQDISALQHHISANNAYYIEVSKDATETVFHYLTDRNIKTFHKPSADLMNDYVDLKEKLVIVKPLTTEAPLKMIDGIYMPTLEKILVDINKDPDFYYLQNNEIYYIMENARSLYSINEPKMLRYASRRGIREDMQELLKTVSHD